MKKAKNITIPLPHICKDLILYIDAKKDGEILINENNEYANEPKFQLKEGYSYDYELSLSQYRLVCGYQKSIIQPRQRKPHEGKIVPNIYVGTLTLEVFHVDTPNKKHEVQLEVQSKKTNYRKDYQYMLNSIAEKCTDLVLQANSPVSHSFETDFEADNETLYQRFAFVKAMVQSEEFEESVQRILSSPTTKWHEQTEQTDVRRIKRFKPNETKQLLHATNRTKLPEAHPLYSSRLTSVVTKIYSNKKVESVDTPENRFVKHALETFSKFCFDIANHPKAQTRLQEEANTLTEQLDQCLQHQVFKDVSRPTTLKLNSPTLQKKEGYRELLKVWLKFDLAAKLVWDGGEDVYKGGKKDIATLYEYWLFFKLLEVIQSVFEIKPKELEKLIVSKDKDLSLQLKQGEFTAIKCVYTKAHRYLNIRFNYNRSFSHNKNLSQSGSWTTTLRPDYTLSIWPTSLKEKEAEAQEQIVHIHFDAKYKVANISQIIESETTDEQLNEEKKDNLKGIYKNADLLKMHAYKDAIRRTSGAYVLYPGDTNKELKGFHEILPGLGAFSIKPSEHTNETLHLENFLREVLAHFLNQASQRENLAAKAYDIHKNDTPNVVNDPLPEYVNGEKLIPDETYVLVGYCKSIAHLTWISNTLLYNFRTDNNRGALKLTKETVNAKYLLLHMEGDESSSRIFKIKKPEFRITKKSTLARLNYPSPRQKKYLVVKLDPCSDKEYQNKTWLFKKLPNYKSGRASAIPFTASLIEFMNVVAKY